MDLVNRFNTVFFIGFDKAGYVMNIIIELNTRYYILIYLKDVKKNRDKDRRFLLKGNRII